MEKNQTQSNIKQEILLWLHQVVAKRYVDNTVPTEVLDKKKFSYHIVKDGLKEVHKIHPRVWLLATLRIKTIYLELVER